MFSMQFDVDDLARAIAKENGYLIKDVREILMATFKTIRRVSSRGDRYGVWVHGWGAFRSLRPREIIRRGLRKINLLYMMGYRDIYSHYDYLWEMYEWAMDYEAALRKRNARGLGEKLKKIYYDSRRAKQSD